MKRVVISIVLLALLTMACGLPSTTPTPSASGAITGQVYADMNANGVGDPGEGPLDAAIISTSGCGEPQSRLSGADGAFEFDNLPLGVCFIEALKEGWAVTGSFPASGYPIPVESKAEESTFLFIYMAPSNGSQSVPDSPAATPEPTSEPATATPTSTPSDPMVTPLDKDVNCRFGPGIEYLAIDALIVGNSVPIVGRTQGNYWWQIESPRFGGGKCFVAANVTQTEGDVESVPIVSAPAAYVTEVDVDVNVKKGIACFNVHTLTLNGMISTNGPASIEYRWVLGGDTSDSTPWTAYDFTQADTLTLSEVGGVGKCGDFYIELQVRGPNDISARDEFSVEIP